jgi:hypothetical protein
MDGRIIVASQTSIMAHISLCKWPSSNRPANLIQENGNQISFGANYQVPKANARLLGVELPPAF